MAALATHRAALRPALATLVARHLVLCAAIGLADGGSEAGGGGFKPCHVPAGIARAQGSADEGCKSVAKAAPVLLQTSSMRRVSSGRSGEPDSLLQFGHGRRMNRTEAGCDICQGSRYTGSTIEIVNNCGYTTSVHTDAGDWGSCRWDGSVVPPCLRDLPPGARATIHLKEDRGVYSFQIGDFGKSTRFEISSWKDWGSASGRPTDSWDISYNAGFDIGMTVILPSGGPMPKVVCTNIDSPAAYQLGADGCQVQPCWSPTWNGPQGHYELHLCNRPGDVDTPGPCGCSPCPGIPCDPSSGRSDCTTSGGGIYCQVMGDDCPLACNGVPSLTGKETCVAECPSSGKQPRTTEPSVQGLRRASTLAPTVTTLPALQEFFEAVDGGVNRACRGSGADDDSAEYYTAGQTSSLEACKALCVNEPACKGIEYSIDSGRCEVWTRAGGIMASREIAGYTCFRYTSAVEATTAVPLGDLFAIADGGSDRACRGADQHDNSVAYYTLEWSATVDGCKASCLKEPTCKGIEYGPDGRCEVWTRAEGIMATQQVAGHTCLVRQAAPATTTTATPVLSGRCHTAVPGDECHIHVFWAKETGITTHPEWYQGLTASSSAEEFQAFLHEKGTNGGVCPEPCRVGTHGQQQPGSPAHLEFETVPTEWMVVSYNVWWWGAPGGDYRQQVGMHRMLARYGEQRVALLGVQECDGGWGTLRRLAGASVNYLTQFAGTKQLCGLYDPAVFDSLEDGVAYLWRMRHLQWVRLRERATGRIVMFVNVHWHHTGGPSVKEVEASHTKQAIMDYAQPGDIVIVTGDFNVFDDTLKAAMNSNFLSLGLRPLGMGDVYGGIDYIWSSHEPQDSASCQRMSDEPYGSDHDPILCSLRAISSSYDASGSTPLHGPWPWRYQ